MPLRRVKRADMPPIARLDYQSVHRVKACDYRPEQIEAWAPRIDPDAFWQRRFRPYSANCHAPSKWLFRLIRSQSKFCSQRFTAFHPPRAALDFQSGNPF
jgi:hypothetical protein